MSAQEIILGEVVAKANHYQVVPDGHSGHRIIKDNAIREYEATFADQCRVYRDRRMNVRFELVVDIWYKSAKFDLDNSIKTLLDCLQYANAITNDSLCFKITANKHLSFSCPKMVFSLVPLEAQEQDIFENNKDLQQ